MDLKFSEMSVDTRLAQEYLNKNKALLELCNDYGGITKEFERYVYDGKEFIKKRYFLLESYDSDEGIGNTLLNLASSLKQNATLIAQLEYLFRNIPIEVTNTQLNLLIQYLRSDDITLSEYDVFLRPEETLLTFGVKMKAMCKIGSFKCVSKATAAISYLFATLLYDARGNSSPSRSEPWPELAAVDSLLEDTAVVRPSGADLHRILLEHVEHLTVNFNELLQLPHYTMQTCVGGTRCSKDNQKKIGQKCCLYFGPPRDLPKLSSWWSKKSPIRELDSGTVAVVSDDADVDSAVDKFISLSTKAPWRLRRILVQESVYQQFKDTLSWKCNLKKSENEPLTSDGLCSDTLTYNDRTFLLDPVELIEEKPSVVTVEAYRTTKEMISLVQQDKTRYLSLWTNGIAEINEVTHSTKSPVVWVNNVADFRGPAAQVAEAVFSYAYIYGLSSVMKCDRSAKLCELSQSWLKLDLESRRDILCGVLDKYILLNPANKHLTDVKNALLTCTQRSFVEVGKDYVCIGMTQPVGVMGYCEDTILSVDSLKSILQGNALYVLSKADEDLSDYMLFKQAGVPVDRGGESLNGGYEFITWKSGLDTQTRVIWTNSGTIFAN